MLKKLNPTQNRKWKAVAQRNIFKIMHGMGTGTVNLCMFELYMTVYFNNQFKISHLTNKLIYRLQSLNT